MAMTPEEVNEALLDFANKRLNTEYTTENAPKSVLLFIERASVYLVNQSPGLQSKRLGDASWAYKEDFPKDILQLLPMPKVRFA